jgi:hypothetical protein
MELVFHGSSGSGQEAAAGNIEIVAFNGTSLFSGEIKVSGLSGKPSINARAVGEVMSIIEQRIKAGKAATWGRRRKDSSEDGKATKPEEGALAGLA